MIRRIRGWAARIEVLVALAVARGLVLAVPFSRWSHWCGAFHCETLRENMDPQRARIRAVRRLLRRTAGRVPWKSLCLDQALAAQWLLHRRKLPTTLYLGMEKSAEKIWAAHAWVRCGDEWVIGHETRDRHTVVGTYAKTIRGARRTSTQPAS